jgi:hypothetical protein
MMVGNSNWTSLVSKVNQKYTVIKNPETDKNSFNLNKIIIIKMRFFRRLIRDMELEYKMNSILI